MDPRSFATGNSGKDINFDTSIQENKCSGSTYCHITAITQ